MMLEMLSFALMNPRLWQDLKDGWNQIKTWGGPKNNETVPRPSCRQSELDAAKEFPEYAEQKSFLNGKEVPYGTKGSVRPDLYKPASSIDVKNYDIGTIEGRNSLARNIAKQYYQRVNNLPAGTQQTVLIEEERMHQLKTLHHYIMV